MIRKADSINEEKEFEEENCDRRHGGKLSGVGTKMAKIFRTAFRKESNNQSKQQLQSKMVLESNENYDKVMNNIDRRKKTRDLSSSDWSSEVDSRSRTNLVEERKKSVDYIHESENLNRDNDIEILKKRKMKKLRRSEHVQSNELEATSMNVTVDIHHENINSKLSKNIEETIVNISSGDREHEHQIAIINNPEKSLDTSLDNSVDSINKKQRKRWSKETNVILPPKRNSLSSTSMSEKSSNWMIADATPRPIPAPRLKKIIDNEVINNLGLDNKAFETDHDEMDQILTIETEYGSDEQTKIKITPVKSESDRSANKQIIGKEIQKSSDYSSGIPDIEAITEIRRFSTDNTRINSEINSEIESEMANKRKSDDVTSLRRKKTSRKLSKSVLMTDNSSSSISDIRRPKRVIGKRHKQEELTKKNIEDSKRSTSMDNDSGTSETSRITEKSSRSTIKKKKEKKKINKKTTIKYISITVHRADTLIPDYITKHPMVIVHIVEESTGSYLKNMKKIKPNETYLQPLITGIFDIKVNKSMAPYWDEELIFEYDFNAILNTKENQTLLLFEIVDLPSVTDASSTHDQFGGHNCWYKLAWAFLKPLSNTGISHVDKVVRLQLYKPKRSLKNINRHYCEPYSWWKSGSREKYPSSLFITVTSIDPPKLEPVFYGHLTLDELTDERMESVKSMTINTETGNLSRWSRLAAQSCKIPNEIFFNTEISDNGCFYVVFSNNGKYLACANYDEYDYPLVIYKIDEEKIYMKFVGHKSFVYALDWSNNDEILLSVSSDQTARLWDIKNKIIQEINMLPHPSYVYCGKFDPTNPDFIVTGCYDHITRLWSRRKNSSNYELIQELDGHEGFVNSICFLKDKDFLTADSLGVIVQWSVKKRKGKLSSDWQMSRKIKIREIKNITINTIVLHPLGSRLLVHSRDNGLRMLDLATGVVLQKYTGLKNTRIQITAKISPCGGLLLCGGEDASLNVWNLESCKHIAKYTTDFPSAAVTCVDYHPYDHVMVYSIFGIPSETIILRYNKQTNGESVGLKLLTVDDHNSHSIVNIESLKSNIKSNERFSQKIINDSDEEQNKESGKNPELLRIDDNREDLRSKLKMINDSEGQFKTRSTNRLTSIIAKIDKILLNSGSTHRSSYDIEANRLNDTMQSRIFIESSTQDDLKMLRPYVPPLFSNFEDNSTESVTKSDIMEMTVFSDENVRQSTKRVVKSKSARCSSAYTRLGPEQTSKTMSDSAINSSSKKSKKSHDKSRKFKSNSSKITVIRDSTNFRPSFKDGHSESSSTSANESGDTYVLEKSDDGKTIESENSMRSDVTFVIESEKPIPIPRRKKIIER